MGRRPACGRHRAALYDFVDRRESGPDTRAALDHLERCGACEVELTEVALTIHALRRALALPARATPGPDAWVHLRARVQRPVRGAWQGRSTLAGVLAGAGLVAALVGPAAVFRPSGTVQDEPGPPPAVLRAHTVADQRAEAAFLNRVRAERAAPVVESPVEPTTAIWFGPDGLGRPESAARRDVAPGRTD